jgi:hypothetical protein
MGAAHSFPPPADLWIGFALFRPLFRQHIVPLTALMSKPDIISFRAVEVANTIDQITDEI